MWNVRRGWEDKIWDMSCQNHDFAIDRNSTARLDQLHFKRDTRRYKFCVRLTLTHTPIHSNVVCLFNILKFIQLFNWLNTTHNTADEIQLLEWNWMVGWLDGWWSCEMTLKPRIILMLLAIVCQITLCFFSRSTFELTQLWN